MTFEVEYLNFVATKYQRNVLNGLVDKISIEESEAKDCKLRLVQTKCGIVADLQLNRTDSKMELMASASTINDVVTQFTEKFNQKNRTNEVFNQ